MEKLCFLSISSGSCGNCYYVGTKTYGFLVDVGIATKTVCQVLEKNGIAPEVVRGIFLTHAHTDHAKGIGTFAKRFNLPVYTTETIRQGVMRNHRVSRKPEFFKNLSLDEPIELWDFQIRTFVVPHDTPECVGFSFIYNNEQLTIATDLGEITPAVIDEVSRANHLVIEANHDENMLISGSYSQRLKERVGSENGHLSNQQTAQFLAKYYHLGLQNIFLCHLSAENNTPQKAVLAVREALIRRGIRPRILTALERGKESELFIF